MTVTPDRAIGAWAAYNASYGLASVVPTPEALRLILPPCLATLRANPYGLAPPELRVARDHAAFVAGELTAGAVASDELRPALSTAPAAQGLVMEVAEALARACSAPPSSERAVGDGDSGAGQAVPQYSAAIEAAASLGQALRQHYIGQCPTALDAVLGITAALSGIAAGKAQGVEAARAIGADKRFSDPKNPTEQKRNGAAIAPWVHAHIGLARMGVGEDAFGVPVAEARGGGKTLNLSLIDGGRMTFTVRAT